jgi:hypothetical protein
MLHSGIMGQTKLILDCGRNKQSNWIQHGWWCFVGRQL